MIQYVRCYDTRATESLYGGYQGQGYQAGDFGAEILVQQGASVSSEQQKTPRLTGYCIEEIQDSHICRWLLLARP